MIVSNSVIFALVIYHSINPCPNSTGIVVGVCNGGSEQWSELFGLHGDLWSACMYDRGTSAQLGASATGPLINIWCRLTSDSAVIASVHYTGSERLDCSRIHTSWLCLERAKRANQRMRGYRVTRYDLQRGCCKYNQHYHLRMWFLIKCRKMLKIY